jgi:alpha-tubulin suppressor-like RCC1 family protein
MQDVGDDELPSDAGAISLSNDLSLRVTQIGNGAPHTCALLSNGSIKCWGAPRNGELGSGNPNVIGDDEPPAAAPALSLTTKAGVVARQLATGYHHSCALLSDGSVVCWGDADGGALGYGNRQVIGDDELPASAGAIVLF